MIPYMVGKLAPNRNHPTRSLVKYVPGRSYFRAVSSQNGDKLVTSPPPPQSWNGSMVIGEVGRCPREHLGPDPDAVRVVSVAIGDVAAESRMEGAGEDPELVGRGVSEVVTEVIPFAVDLVVAMMVFWRGLAGARGSENREQGKGEVRFFLKNVAGCTLSGTVIRT